MNFTTPTDAAKDAQAEAIRAMLGPGWVNDSIANHPGRRLVHKSYPKLSAEQDNLRDHHGYGVHLRWTDDRINITGVWPTNAKGEQSYPSTREFREAAKGADGISVRADRESAVVAREIKNRFLTAYLPLYRAQVDRVTGQNAHAYQTARTKGAILGLPGAHDSRHSEAVYLRDSHVYSVTPQGDSVRFEAFNCPADVALRVLALLKKEAE